MRCNWLPTPSGKGRKLWYLPPTVDRLSPGVLTPWHVSTSSVWASSSSIAKASGKKLKVVEVGCYQANVQTWHEVALHMVYSDMYKVCWSSQGRLSQIVQKQFLRSAKAGFHITKHINCFRGKLLGRSTGANLDLWYLIHIVANMLTVKEYSNWSLTLFFPFSNWFLWTGD